MKMEKNQKRDLSMIDPIEPSYRPKTSRWIMLSIQHVFAMFSATVLVPMLTGLPISVALIASGLGTLIYILCTKHKVPIYLGSSFAYIEYITSVCIYSEVNGVKVVGSYGPALTGLVAVGLIYVIVAGFIKLFGTKWLNKLLPPIVVGPMIMVIGLSLSSSAIGNTGLTLGGDWRAVVVSFATILIVAFFAIKGKGFVKVIPFLLGIVGGYIVAIIMNFIPNGENTSIVGMTKVGSVWVTGGAAVIAILLSFCNVFTTLIATIPASVMGGVCLILYGFIASNGLRTLLDSKIDLTQTRNLIIISVILVIGIGGAAIYSKSGMKIFTSVAISSIVGVILNLILPKENDVKETENK